MIFCSSWCVKLAEYPRLAFNRAFLRVITTLHAFDCTVKYTSPVVNSVGVYPQAKTTILRSDRHSLRPNWNSPPLALASSALSTDDVSWRRPNGITRISAPSFSRVFTTIERRELFTMPSATQPRASSPVWFESQSTPNAAVVAETAHWTDTGWSGCQYSE